MVSRAVVMLKLLLCVPILTSAFLSFNSAKETQQDALDEQDKEIIKGLSENENNTWKCPEGWTPYSSDTELSCIVLVRQTKKFRPAQSHCHSLGGLLVSFNSPHKEAFVKQLAKRGEGGDHWIGLYKDEGYDSVFAWQTRNSTVSVNFDNLPVQVRDYVRYNEQCGYISGYSYEVEIENCDTEYFSICEQDVSCKPGTFGDKCQRECHCVGEPCQPQTDHGPEGAICKYGCQRNWMGAACDTEKHDAEVKYYCVNSAEKHGKYVYIRVYPNGLQYRSIYGLTSNKVRGDWCNSTVVETHSSNLTTIRIPVNNANIAQMASGECAGQSLGEDTFTWAIVLKENDGILQEHDMLMNITCDFNVADSLVRSGKYGIQGEAHHLQEKTFSPESTQGDVLLQVVNPYSEASLSEAVIGSSVILEMKYALQQGSLLTGVHPYNCEASSPDGTHVKHLLDENGCQVSNSPVQTFSPADDKKIKTPWFGLFTFENESFVTFRCSFDLCFTSDCTVGCWSPSRQRRDTEGVRDEVSHSTTRTIRVLPSIPAKGDSQATEYQPAPPPAAPPGYDIGPFVYLNPVTCTLFLLILLVFLCMYIAFIRTLRKSVYDIRKEIEVRRSRDKFLHCGCVQQKDRDYVAP